MTSLTTARNMPWLHKWTPDMMESELTSPKNNWLSLQPSFHQKAQLRPWFPHHMSVFGGINSARIQF